jgi:hypothetical protein
MATGTQATPEVIQSWVEVYNLFQECKGERRERLQQVAERLGVTYKIARRRLRNYEAMHNLPTSMPPPATARAAHRRADNGEDMSNPLEFEDRQMTCADCGEGYVWSAADQEFYKKNGYEQPKRCKPCRQAKKAQREGMPQRGGNR